jgi:hypothetical protein
VLGSNDKGGEAAGEIETFPSTNLRKGLFRPAKLAKVRAIM